MTPSDDLQRLVERIEAATAESAEREELGIAINEALGIASYITDDGDPTQSIDAAMTLIEAEWFWRVGHDGEGADPSLFRADVGEPVNFGFVRAVAATPALALASASLRARITQEQSNDRSSIG